LIARCSGPDPDAGGQYVSFDLPDGLPSGDYYVRMVISKEMP
jgi:hypothetical protein